MPLFNYCKVFTAGVLMAAVGSFVTADSLDFDFTSVAFPSEHLHNKTIITGVAAIDNAWDESSTLYLSGYSTSDSQVTIGVLFKGAFSGSGIWTELFVPNSPNSTVVSSEYFSPIAFSDDSIRLVGNYRTEQSAGAEYGFLFQGYSDGTGTYSAIKPSTLVSGSDSLFSTFPRGIANSLIVGYYTSVSTGSSATSINSFVYDLTTDTYYELLFPAGSSLSAHGIQQFPSSSDSNTYLIVGSVTTTDGDIEGFICHWDNDDHVAYGFQLFQRSSSARQTHFNGLYVSSSVSTVSFNVISAWMEEDASTGAKSYGQSIATIANVSNYYLSTAQPTWTDFAYPNSNNNTAVGICGAFISGSMQPTSGVNVGNELGYIGFFAAASHSSSASALSNSAIIAIVVCVAVAIVLIGSFLFYRKVARDRAAKQEKNTEMHPTDSPMTGSTFQFKDIA